MPHLQTERLYLRPLTLADADDYFRVVGDEEVGKWLAFQRAFTLDETKQYIERQMKRWRETMCCNFGIFLKQSNELIGHCGLGRLPSREVELYYALAQPHWGHGYATEAGQAVLNYGYAQLKLDTIIGLTKVANENSKHVLTKLGMTYVGEQEYFGFPCAKFTYYRPLPNPHTMSVSTDLTAVNAWQWLTDPVYVAQYFFGTKLETTWEVGSPITFSGSFNGVDYVDRGIVTEYMAGYTFSYTYRSSFAPAEAEEQLITYRLENGVLTVTQNNIATAEQSAHSEQLWSGVLAGLKTLV